MATVVVNTERRWGASEFYSVSDFIWGVYYGQVLTPTKYVASYSADFVTLEGSGFTYVSHDVPSAGVISRIYFSEYGEGTIEITGLSFSVAHFNELVNAGNIAADTQLKSELFAGDDSFQGGAGMDYIRSFAGADTVSAGAGDDYVLDTSGSNYLRGDDGNDRITGGDGFDDINGNMGNDTASGGLGDDWVVGGKDNDSLSGDAGSDLVYGNLGADTCEGGAGNDIVRGGQENDLVSGGDGDDYVSGDKGEDTVTGGAGADLFHTFGDAGIDRVTDFSQAQGDRVLLDAGTQYAAAQVGADTVISMTSGGQMILVGVQLASLTPGWIFGN